MSQSPFQLMYNLYNIIALTELKGYAMLQFAYMTLRINNQVHFSFKTKFILLIKNVSSSTSHREGVGSLFCS
jgi:hypothetical protein